AYHEAGHTIVGLVLSRARVVHKVTIIPRGRAGGYMIALPKEDQFLMTKDDMFEQIVGLLGGRTAEEIIFNVQSTGASNDFEQATALARSMVTEYGMSDRLGPVQYEGNHQVFVGRDYGLTKAYSEQVAFEIDQEVRKILMEAHAKAHEIIEAHRAQHKLIAEKLLEFETLDAKAIKSLFEHGVMPEGTESNDYPSEKEAKTFEEAKRALEEKYAEKQAEEKRDFEEAKHELHEENKAEHDSDSQRSEDNHSDDQYK
ncbi:MAG TPA: cell division protein FtsH, partial [Enterococcus sp.]|nr:cell division protein FtsH [Enterococcus sp.]